MGWHPGLSGGSGECPGRDPGVPGVSSLARDPRLAVFAGDGSDGSPVPLAASPMPAARSWAAGMLTDRNLRIAAEAADIAAALGTSPASVALAWAAAQPGITGVIIGPRTCGQLRGNLEGLSLTLPPDALARLSDISTPVDSAPVTGMGAQR